MNDANILDSLFNIVLQINPVSVMSLFVATTALVLSWLNRRSQKSARIAIEIFSRTEGIFLAVSNVGDRIAYDCELSVNPKDLNSALKHISVIAPQRSFQAFLCAHGDVPSDQIRVVVKYHDPVHKKTKTVDKASFDTSRLEEYQVLLNKDFGCFEVKR